jgi:threonine synthase
MKYHSTRHDHLVTFRDTLFNGIAENGGLYIPESIPEFDLSELVTRSFFSFKKKPRFNDISFKVCRKFIDPKEIPDQDLKRIIRKSFGTFRCKKITPLIQLNPKLFILELFHGPTYAFKDIALQFLGNVLQYFLQQNKKSINVICATSGDTGSAAIYAVLYKSEIRCFVLHPKDRISSIQKAQMTSVLDDNIFNYEIEGTFDDCQRIVKILNASVSNTTTFNSINWCRIMVQITYYFYAYAQYKQQIQLQPQTQIQTQKVSFSVPTGNFGDILAGFYAQRMGLPIDKLVIATNENQTLSRFMKTGQLHSNFTIQTLSPAMDISLPSNIERLLYYYGYNYQTQSIPRDQLIELQKIFLCESITNELTLRTIQYVHDQYNYKIDPHTAVGIAAAATCIKGAVICLATAHPGKFPETMKMALNDNCMPKELSDLLSKTQMYKTLSKSDAISTIRNDISRS